MIRRVALAQALFAVLFGAASSVYLIISDGIGAIWSIIVLMLLALTNMAAVYRCTAHGSKLRFFGLSSLVVANFFLLALISLPLWFLALLPTSRSLIGIVADIARFEWIVTFLAEGALALLVVGWLLVFFGRVRADRSDGMS